MKEYTIQIGGIAHTVLLSDADAEKYGDGAVPVGEKAAKAPANKARSSRTKADKTEE